MKELVVDRIMTLTLLVLGVAYLLVMLSYPSNAGMVPAIVATVFVGVMAVQLLFSFLKPRGRSPSGTPAPDGDGDASLFFVTGAQRRRLFTIIGWTLAFFVGSLAVGFVVTTAVLVTGVLLLHRESPVVVLAVAAASFAGAYLLVVIVLEQRFLSGWLFY